MPLLGCFLWSFDRLDDPSEVASDAVFFASDEATYVTGETIYVDGGCLGPTHDSGCGKRWLARLNEPPMVDQSLRAQANHQRSA